MMSNVIRLNISCILTTVLPSARLLNFSSNKSLVELNSFTNSNKHLLFNRKINFLRKFISYILRFIERWIVNSSSMFPSMNIEITK